MSVSYCSCKSSLCAIPSRYTGAQTPPGRGRRTEKQQAAWDALAFGPKTQKELEEQGVTKAVLAGLVKKALAGCFRSDKKRSAARITAPRRRRSQPLAQQVAYSRLAALMDTGWPAAVLLHGVTSSGKTLVFLKLIEKAVAAQGVGAGAGKFAYAADDLPLESLFWRQSGRAVPAPQQ